jgi:DNA-binding winged helix-turn-helix (wHTH) protein/tetratricopeptide (TPR) repeat protein/TolB-like protein
MDASTPERKLARFGLFEADLQQRVLTKSGLRVRLQDQPFQVLALLLERPGEIVPREEIRQRLWSADTYVEFDDGLNTAIKKLRMALGDEADNPRFIETVPRRGYKFVAPVSFPAPADPLDLAKSAEVVPENSLVAPREQFPVVSEKAPPQSWRFWAVGGLLLVAGSLLFYRTVLEKLVSAGHVAPPPPPIKTRLSVAVLGFRNLSQRPEEEWLSPALAEMLTTELSAGEQIRTIPGENVARTKHDLSLPDSDSYAKDTLLHIRQNLGADVVVLGSYFDLGKVSGGAIRLDLRLQDARTGELLASISKAGTEADLPALASLVGTDLRQRLGGTELSKAQEASLSDSRPSNHEAARLYSEGLTKLRAYDDLGAQALLEKSISSDPDFAPAHAALADALSFLGYDARSRDEAEKAFDLSNSLSREQRLQVEARYREATQEWNKAIETYRTLFQLFPDNIEYGLRLASAQNLSGKGSDAMITVGQLRRLPPPSSEDPRVDIAEAKTARSQGDNARTEAAARKAAEKAQALGARFLVASARNIQCWALNKLGHVEQAIAACDESRRIFAEAGDRVSAARLLVTSGAVLKQRGQFASAKSRYEEALTIYHTVGAQASVATVLNNLAALNLDSGNYAAAKDMAEQSASLARKIGDQRTLVLALGNLAYPLVYEGDLKGGRAKIEESLDICRRLGSKDDIALQLGNLGDLLLLQGDLPGSLKTLEEAAALDVESGDKRQLGYVLASFGDVFQAQAKLPEARQKRQESLKTRTPLGNKVELASTRVALAKSSIEEGQSAEAVEPLRQAIAEFKELKSEVEEASAYPVLARALTLAGNPAEALKTMESGTDAASRSHNRMVQFAFAIVEAQVRAANGQVSPAKDSLTRIIAETKKSGFVGYQLEARLAFAEIELKSAKNVGARAHLKALERDARERGFLLIANRAAAQL